MWDLPGPGLEPTSPALAGGFLTTVPPGKSLNDPLQSSWGASPRKQSPNWKIEEGAAGGDESHRLNEHRGEKSRNSRYLTWVSRVQGVEEKDLGS